MKIKKPAEMSNEELIKAEKTAKAVTYVFGGILLLLFIANIFLGIQKGFNASMVVPIALLPILIVNISSLSEMQKEMKSRNLD